MKKSIINGLLSRLRPNFECFFKISECLSELEMYLAFVTYAQMYQPITRPRFDRDLVLVNAVHPILMALKEHTISRMRNEPLVISNDKLMSNSIRIGTRNSFILLTGSNMSGKSTFLKQLGIFDHTFDITNVLYIKVSRLDVLNNKILITLIGFWCL